MMMQVLMLQWQVFEWVSSPFSSLPMHWSPVIKMKPDSINIDSMEIIMLGPPSFYQLRRLLMASPIANFSTTFSLGASFAVTE